MRGIPTSNENVDFPEIVDDFENDLLSSLRGQSPLQKILVDISNELPPVELRSNVQFSGDGLN